VQWRAGFDVKGVNVKISIPKREKCSYQEKNDQSSKKYKSNRGRGNFDDCQHLVKQANDTA
jgi:threonine synthase